MGLFSLMSKKSVAPGTAGVGSGPSLHKYDRNSPGKIMPREMSYIQHKLIDKLGRRKAERVMEHLEGNMDKDGGFGTKNVSSKEIDAIVNTLEKSHYNEMDSGDIATTRKILEGYK